ncbi:Inorganic pyrophosphatase [Entomortierella chlamydospora]|uniref:Inorganic pyrophosphatase n=1 Tax=Entomortierella chlamydospora TaxID=101097 RepID=A0A9P6T3A6_9FUNG|nr:Inorganic pyrophosphatase [Entomortierella chlamydospora]KAG0021656.1 Inorganic pyrophosphatase [Entomortierella chlamydospora]
MSAYSTRVIGAPNTLEHRVYIEKDGAPVSAFHDIPLYANEAKNVYNMIVEIPRWSNAKLEISKDEEFNPIKQDVKKGKLRFVRNCFPHKGYIWNYGALPQTWEDPTHIDKDTNARGDNDPLDVCEIGEQVGYTGQIKQVKALGVMALLDEGETDWKVIVIDVKDPLADQLNDIADVERVFPGLIDATRDWFRIYKKPDGKPENEFAFNGAAKDKAYATKVIEETNVAWKRLISGEIPAKAEAYDVKVSNLHVQDSPHRVAADHEVVKSIPAASAKPAAPIDASIDKWFFTSNM